MGASHSHGHSHAHETGRAADRRRLALVLAITGSVVVVELVGALVSGSLALLADAGHMLTDAAGLVVALSASVLATRPPSDRRTYGYHRIEILAAGLNAVVLILLCGYLTYAAIGRLLDPVKVEAGQMLGFAIVGLLANLVSMTLLTARRDSSLNMKGAYLEVLSDTLGSVAAIAAAIVVLATGFDRADAIASLVIAAMVLPRAASLLRDVASVLLESAPAGLDLAEVRTHLGRVEGVIDVHDLHAWTITSGMPALSAHVTVTDEALAARGVGAVLDDLSDCVAECFTIEHVTFQVEPASHRAHESDLVHR